MLVGDTMEKEKKIELECDYCGVPITEKDFKCPKCGANCTDKIKKYQKQQETISLEEKAKEAEYSKKIADDLGKSMERPVKIFVGIVALMIIIVAITIFVNVSSFKQRNNGSEPIGEEKTVVKENYNSNVGFNELGETAKCMVQLDSYELYSYVSDKFPDQYNTPAGYQKIAFHFTYENKRSSDEYISSSDIRLKADGYKVDTASLKLGTFEKVETGKDHYTSIDGTYAGPGEKIQGYAGFLVPKNAKELKFSFDGVTITMDNPVYVEG